MKVEDFRNSVSGDAPPGGIVPALQALWWAAKGDWNQAHKVCQAHEDDNDVNWVHAHLHHQEGDMRNAGGWYRRAGKPVATCSVQDEWTALAGEFLARK